MNGENLNSLLLETGRKLKRAERDYLDKSYVGGRWGKVKKNRSVHLLQAGKKRSRNVLAVKHLLTASYPFTDHKNPRPLCCVFSTKSTITF
jgi:hypothetical protein